MVIGHDEGGPIYGPEGCEFYNSGDNSFFYTKRLCPDSNVRKETKFHRCPDCGRRAALDARSRKERRRKVERRRDEGRRRR
jgi:hypothetical protein